MKPRNPIARAAHFASGAGPHRDRRSPRGGSRAPLHAALLPCASCGYRDPDTCDCETP